MRAIILAAALLAGCGEKVSAPADSYAIPEFEWRIRSAEDLRAVYANSGEVLGKDQVIEGFVGTDAHGRDVIYTKRPKTVDDAVACTLGHEVMHLALGDYHR